MTRDELLQFFDRTTAAMRATMVKKNADYTDGAAADPFANFTRVEALGIATTVQGFLTRMTDKLMRINSLSKKGGIGAVADESMTDTVLDLANYSILLAAYLSEGIMDRKKLADELEKEAGVMDEGQLEAVEKTSRELTFLHPGEPCPPAFVPPEGKTVKDCLRAGLRLCPLTKDGSHIWVRDAVWSVRDDADYRKVTTCACGAAIYTTG